MYTPILFSKFVHAQDTGSHQRTRTNYGIPLYLYVVALVAFGLVKWLS